MNHPQRLATDADIANAAAAFWGVISDKFPEITSGDTQITGEDHAAFAIWANNDPGDRPTGMASLPLPRQITLDRVAQAVEEGMAAAKAVLPSVIDSNRPAAFNELVNCACGMIRWNFVAPNDGTFEVHVYKTQQEWDACKGAGDIRTGIATDDDAIGLAESAEFDDAYQVTVRAVGNHEDYEPGEGVYTRFDREEKTARMRP